MGRAIEKAVALFCVIVFITFLINHGHIDFSGVDWVTNKAKEVVSSDERQEYINETKEISKDVFHDLFYGIKEVLTNEQENSSDGSKLTAATLLSCVDGDTIKVSINEKEQTIRLIGIDAPETVNPDESLNNEFGEKSSNYTKALLENVSTVYLEYDVSLEYTYGRTLAYVWLSDTRDNPEVNMLNAILVKNGYAKDEVYMPNSSYADLFLELSQTAQENQQGLWKYSGFSELWNE